MFVAFVIVLSGACFLVFNVLVWVGLWGVAVAC